MTRVYSHTADRTRKGEKHPFNDKQSQIAERKAGDQQGPGDRSKTPRNEKSPMPTEKYLMYWCS
jgi:hypothetical protein